MIVTHYLEKVKRECIRILDKSLVFLTSILKVPSVHENCILDM